MTDQDEVIQSEVLIELKEILADDFPELVTTYLEDAMQRMDRLETAIAASDASNVKLEAHSLKGASANIGARNLADLCAEMENQGEAERLEQAPELFSKIRSQFSATEQYLNQQL